MTGTTPQTVFPLLASHLADNFNLKALKDLFFEPPFALDSTRIAFKFKTGYCFIYAFGTISFFDVSKPDQQKVLESLTARHTLLRERHDSDEFLVEVQSDTQNKVSFDRVTLAELSFEKIDMIALILAESVTLDFYDRLVDDLLEKSIGTMEQLERKGQLTRTTSDLYRFLGISMSTKQKIVSNLFLLDNPDILWENQELERLYYELFKMFELRERFQGMVFKLNALQEDMGTIASLTASRRSERLEVAIVGLIVVEIIILLVEFFSK